MERTTTGAVTSCDTVTREGASQDQAKTATRAAGAKVLRPGWAAPVAAEGVACPSYAVLCCCDAVMLLPVTLTGSNWPAIAMRQPTTSAS